MESLSQDVLIEMFLDYSLSDILSLSLADKNINDRLCNSSNFWARKLYKDYGIRSNDIGGKEASKKVYETLDSKIPKYVYGVLDSRGGVVELFNSLDDAIEYISTIEDVETIDDFDIYKNMMTNTSYMHDLPQYSWEDLDHYIQKYPISYDLSKLN